MIDEKHEKETSQITLFLDILEDKGLHEKQNWPKN